MHLWGFDPNTISLVNLHLSCHIRQLSQIPIDIFLRIQFHKFEYLQILKAFLKGTYINVYQTWSDRKLLFLARRLKKEKIFDQVFVNAHGFTVVRKKDQKGKGSKKNQWNFPLSV